MNEIPLTSVPKDENFIYITSSGLNQLDPLLRPKLIGGLKIKFEEIRFELKKTMSKNTKIFICLK